MKKRIEIYNLLKRIEKATDIPLTNTLDPKILEVIHQQSGTEMVNYFYDLEASKKYHITENSCFSIQDLIYKDLFSELEITVFNKKIENKEIKENLKKYELSGFLEGLNSFVNVKNIVTSMLITEISKGEQVKTQNLEFKVGRKLILLFYSKILNHKIEQTIILDNDVCKEIIIELYRKTPRCFPIAKNFPKTCTLFSKTDKKTVDLIICILFFYSDKLSENVWQDAAIELQFPTENLAKILKKRFLNIINIYAKRIAIECFQMFQDLGIIEKNKIQKTYVFCSHIKFGVLGLEKLPHLYLEKNTEKIRKYKYENIADPYSVLQIFNQNIQHDFMTGKILDGDIWFKSMGLQKLNLVFIYQFLKNFVLILDKIKECDSKSLTLEEEEIHFLEQIFNISIINLEPELLAQIVYYCLDFSFEKNSLEKPEKLNIKNIINKIRTNKYILLKALKQLGILLKFETFEYMHKFDARGRAYPDASIIHHQMPLFRHFITFTSICKNKDLEKVACELYESVRDFKIDNLQSEIIRNITNKQRKVLPLRKFFGAKNIFETYLFYMDYINLATENLCFYSAYKLDARSSGLQIITMLLNDDALSQKIGMSNSREDVYTQFINFYKNHERKIEIHPLILDTSQKGLIDYIFTINQKTLKNYIEGEFIVAELTLMLTYFNFDVLKNYFKKDKKKEKKILTKYQILGFFEDFSNFYIFSQVLELFLIREKTRFEYLVQRALVKPALMTYFYGSTLQSRLTGYLDFFLTQKINNQSYTTDLVAFKKFVIELDCTMVKWIAFALPESIILIKAMRFSCNKKQFFCVPFETTHCIWEYTPFCSEKYSKSILNRDYKLKKYINQIDIKKLKTSFIANYIQFIDADLCSFIIGKLVAQQIPVRTTHDCFSCSHIHADALRKAIFEGYIYIIKQNYLEKHFKASNEIFYTFIQQQKQYYGSIPIKTENIPKDASTLVK